MMLEWVNGCINSLDDDEFRMELSPGKNHGVWILGHLVVSEDDFSIFMGNGELLFPELVEFFAQKSKLQPPENYPPVPELRGYWDAVCRKNREIYSQLADDELDMPHALLENDDTDYFKTKKRVIMAWQFHQMYHAGQLAVLVARAGKSKY